MFIRLHLWLESGHGIHTRRRDDGLRFVPVYLLLVITQLYQKPRTQYYAAFGAILGIILVSTLQLMLHESTSFQVFGGVVIGFLQLIAVTMLVLSAGGMSVKSLAGEMTHAYEVIRRGEEHKEVIVPLTGDMPKPRAEPKSSPIPVDEPPPKIDLE